MAWGEIKKLGQLFKDGASVQVEVLFHFAVLVEAYGQLVEGVAFVVLFKNGFVVEKCLLEQVEDKKGRFGTESHAVFPAFAQLPVGYSQFQGPAAHRFWRVLEEHLGGDGGGVFVELVKQGVDDVFQGMAVYRFNDGGVLEL